MKRLGELERGKELEEEVDVSNKDISSHMYCPVKHPLEVKRCVHVSVHVFSLF